MCEVGHARALRAQALDMGGLKGQTAPGDAHPYLALFGVLRRAKPPARRKGFPLLSLTMLGILPFRCIHKKVSK